MRSLACKVPKEDAKRYLRALETYGLERSTMFLRRCVYQLIKHAEAGDKLQLPLDFVLSNKKPAIHKSRRRKKKQAGDTDTRQAPANLL
jgi:hypothetical protein